MQNEKDTGIVGLNKGFKFLGIQSLLWVFVAIIIFLLWETNFDVRKRITCSVIVLTLAMVSAHAILSVSSLKRVCIGEDVLIVLVLFLNLVFITYL